MFKKLVFNYYSEKHIGVNLLQKSPPRFEHNCPCSSHLTGLGVDERRVGVVLGQLIESQAMETPW